MLSFLQHRSAKILRPTEEAWKSRWFSNWLRSLIMRDSLFKSVVEDIPPREISESSFISTPINQTIRHWSALTVHQSSRSWTTLPTKHICKEDYLNTIDAFGQTPLNLASLRGNTDVITCIIGLPVITSIDDNVIPELDAKSLHHNPKIVQSKLVPLFAIGISIPN